MVRIAGVPEGVDCIIGDILKVADLSGDWETGDILKVADLSGDWETGEILCDFERVADVGDLENWDESVLGPDKGDRRVDDGERDLFERGDSMFVL